MSGEIWNKVSSKFEIFAVWYFSKKVIFVLVQVFVSKALLHWSDKIKRDIGSGAANSSPISLDIN